MAEKYRAKSNNLNEEIPEKTEKEKRQESVKKGLQIGAKFIPGVGGKIANLAVNTKFGQNILDRASSSIAQNPIASQLMKKADDSGLVDKADKAVDILSKNPKGVKENDKNTLNSNNGLEKNDSLNSSKNNKSDEIDNTGKKNNSFFGSVFVSGKFNFKLIWKKYLFICAISCFGFLMFLILIAGAHPFAKLDLTNGSTNMTSTGPSYVTGTMNVVAPEAISNIDDSVIDGKNGTILSDGNTLNSLLGNSGLTALNQSILESAQNAGYGTGAAPAAAAHALIENLLNNKIKIPYFWGGGHGVISTGADGNWGTYTKVSAGGHSTSFSNQPLGLDCSGFVSWALYNGGCKNFTPILAASFKNLGPNISFNNAKTGDIAASNTHVVLILENRGDNLLVAEAKGTAYGVIFSLKNASSLNTYSIVDMSNYYQQNCS